MKIEEKWNLSQLIKIILRPPTVNNDDIYWYEEKKTFFGLFTPQEKGWYMGHHIPVKIEEELIIESDKYFIQESKGFSRKILMNNFCVTLIFVNEYIKRKYFKTEQGAQEYYYRITEYRASSEKPCNLIEL